jgi:uncharacterized membrane protein
MQRLWESIFGLKHGFLNRDGELSIGFNPRWPTEPLVDAGSWNWLLGLLAVAGLAYLFARLRDDAPPRHAWQRRIAAAVGALAVVAAFAAFNAGAALLVALLVAAVEFLGTWRWRLWLARLLVVGFLFTLLSGTAAFNLALAALALAVVAYVYPREGRSAGVRVSLGVIRAALLAFVIALLNRPVLNLGQDLVDPSVLAVLVDDSISMSVRDLRPDDAENSPSRLEGVVDLLTRDDQALVRRLAAQHQVRFYEFDGTARQQGPGVGDGRGDAPPDAAAAVAIPPELTAAIRGLKPEGQTTAVLPSLIGVMEELQGQRLAGVVLITDGVETAAATGRTDELLKRLRGFNARVYPVAVGSEKAPTNIAIESVNVQDAVFVDDIVLFRMTVRGSGFPANHPVTVSLKTAGGAPLLDAAGKPAQRTVNLPDANPMEVELAFKPDRVGTLEIQAVAERQAGEIDPRDNVRPTQVAVLDAKINVLYVDGYPRWEYRYLKNEMMRDRTVNISLLLTSADPAFAQEGDAPDPPSGIDAGSRFPGPIKRFPETMDELMRYDVVVFGDVDPRQFSDRQLQLLTEFVARKGGGFGMVAGPRWSPHAFRNAPIEAILPVNIARAQPDTDTGVITEGFRPALTKAGAASSIFRFLPDRAANETFIAEGLEPLFWYCRGVTVKPGVGEVYAEHPVETAPDGRKAPLLVLGRFGAGRTLFSAVDDSWRWRYYTGESIFDTYWVQQLRHLARSRKIGQRRFNFTTDRDTYTLGEPVRLELNVLDPVLAQQLPADIHVQVVDESGQAVRRERLERQETPPDTYAASFTADRVGRYAIRLPALGGGGGGGAAAPTTGPAAPTTAPAGAAGGAAEDAPLDLPIEVIVPRLELVKPAVDMALLRQVAARDERTGQPIVLDLAGAARLPELIPSAARTIPILTPEPLWDAPLAFLIFIVLLTAEWVLRKMYGML